MKAVIFDMDGVIVDSEAVHTKMKIQTLNEYGIDCSPEDCLPYFGRSSKDFFREFIKASSKDIVLEEIVARKHELFREYLADENDIAPIDGAVELINDFYEKNIPLALASSSAMANIKMFLKKFGVFDCFDVVLSGAELPASKPDPEIYLLAAQKLGVKPQECIVIEDAAAGITAAKKAGSYCVAYRNPAYKACRQDTSAADMQVDSLNRICAESIMKM